MGIAGLGIGTIFAGLPALIVGAVPVSETGSAMSFNQVLRYVGYSAGSALAATILQAHTAAGQLLPVDRGYSIAGLMGIGGLILAAVLSAVLPARKALGSPGVRPIAAPIETELAQESDADSFPLEHENLFAADPMHRVR